MNLLLLVCVNSAFLAAQIGRLKAARSKEFRFGLLSALVFGISISLSTAAPAAASSDLSLKELLEVDPQDFAYLAPTDAIKACSFFLGGKEGLSQQDSCRLLLLRGNAFYQVNDYDSAIKDFGDVIKLDGENELARTQHADAMVNLGLVERAFGEYKALVKTHPKYAGARASLAGCYLAQGDVEHCIASASKAIALDPTNGLAYRFRGHAYIMHGDWKLALEDANKCIELNYGAGTRLAKEPFITRGLALNSLDRPQLALPAFLIATQIDPSCIPARMGIWSVYLNTGKYGLCRKLGEKIASQTDKPLFRFLVRVVDLVIAGRAEEALQVAKKEIKACRDEPLAYWQLGNCYFLCGNYQAALESYNTILDVNDQEMFISASKAFLLATCPDGKYRDGRTALKLAEECCRRCGDQNPKFLILRAIAHAECGEFDKAVSTAKKALCISRPNFHLRKEYENRLKLFEQKKPYRFSVETRTLEFLWF